MTLTTNCRACHCKLVVTLDNSMTDAEVENIGARLYCVPCAVARQSQHTLADDAPDAPQATGTAGNKSGNPTKSEAKARVLNTPDSL